MTYPEPTRFNGVGYPETYPNLPQPTRFDGVAEKVSQSLSNAGICKRGRKGRHAPETVLKAFSNVALG